MRDALSPTILSGKKQTMDELNFIRCGPKLPIGFGGDLAKTGRRDAIKVGVRRLFGSGLLALHV